MSLPKLLPHALLICGSLSGCNALHMHAPGADPITQLSTNAWEKHLLAPVSVMNQAPDEWLEHMLLNPPAGIKGLAGKVAFTCDQELHPALQSFFHSLNQSGGLNHETLRLAYENDYIGLKVKIRNGTVCESIKNSKWTKAIQQRWTGYKALLQRVVDNTALPDMDLILSLLDKSPGAAGVLRVEGRVGADFLAVPRSLLNFDVEGAVASFNAARSRCASETPKFVFRGSTTGSKYNIDDVRNGEVDCLRYKAVNKSQTRSDILDVGFTRVCQSNHADLVTQILEERGFMKPFLNDEQQLCNAGVVVIDGNSLPDRFPRQLAYGIPNVFLHDQSNDEFWYPELRPGIDYAMATPETLIEVVEALVRNKTRAAAIGANGQAFALNRFSERSMLCYMKQALEEYAKVFNFDPSQEKDTC